eukprot:m.70268 g.70268  ORF g.70268 m.70268 type:complete len:476 (+) comp8304_c0_seq1:89-1516(+)
MSTTTVTLVKGSSGGFGFSITGGFPTDVIVSKITPGSPAEGNLQVGDRLMKLNGNDLHNLSQSKVVLIVRTAGSEMVVEYRRTGSRDGSPALGNPAVVSSPQTVHKTVPKPVVTAKPVPAKPTRAPKKEESSTSNSPPQQEVTRANEAISRVIAASRALGIAVSDDASKSLEQRLASVVEQLESGSSSGYDALVLKRLANVISRLENVATTLGATSVPTNTTGCDLSTVVARIEGASAKITGTPFSSQTDELVFNRPIMSASGELEDVEESMIAYDELLQTHLRTFLEKSKEIGDDVEIQADYVKNAFICQRLFMTIVPTASRPGPKVYPLLTEASKNSVRDVVTFKEACTGSEFATHLLVVAEGIPSLGWIDMGEKPVPFIKEMTDCSEFFANRIMKEKNPEHTAWAKSYLDLLRALGAYVKKYHPTGPVWGKKMRSMTFWSNAIAQTAPGEGDADMYVFNARLGVPLAVNIGN